MKFQFFKIFILVFTGVHLLWAEAKLEHLVEIRSSVNSPVTSVPSGFYKFNVSWYEWLSQPGPKYWNNTYLKPTSGLFISPYTSYASTSIDLKMLKWVKVGVGYRRLFYQRTALSFDSIPKNSEITADKIFENAFAQGNFAGADIFVFTGQLSYISPYFSLSVDVASELWNVDVPKKTHVYEYSHDQLIESNEALYTTVGSLKLYIKPFVIPEIKNYFIYISGLREYKHRVDLGLTQFPIIRNSNLRFNLWVGYWTHHPLHKVDNFFESLLIHSSFNWDFLLGQ